MKLNPELGAWRVGEQLIVAGETRWIVSRSLAFAGLVTAMLKSERDGRRRALPLLRRGELASRGLLRGAAIGGDPEAADRGRAAFAAFAGRYPDSTVMLVDDYRDGILTQAVAGCRAGARVYPVRVGAFPLVAGPLLRQGDEEWLAWIRQRIAGRRQVFDLASSAAEAVCLKPRPMAGEAIWSWIAADLLPAIEAHLRALLEGEIPSMLVAGGDGSITRDRALPPRPGMPAASEAARDSAERGRAVDRHAGPVAGIVGHVEVAPAVPGAPVHLGSGLEAALAGWPGAGHAPEMTDYLDACEYGSFGYGHGAEAARRSVVFEALEGYCWLHRGDEAARRGRLQDFERGLSGQAFQALDDSQVAALPVDVAAFLRGEAECSWTQLRRLRPSTGDGDGDGDGDDGGPLWVQSALLYGCHPEIAHAYLGQLADVNGLGCGESLAAARRHALLEVMERDAVAIWWYAGGPAAAVDPGSLCADARAALDFLRDGGRSAWLLAIPNDLGVAVVAAISCEPDGRRPLFGFGAGLHLVEAARRASAELYMRLDLVAAPGDRTGGGRRAEGRNGDAFAAWCETARVDDHPWLSPAGAGAVSAAPPTAAPAMDAAGDVDRLLQRLERIGLRAYELDLSRPDVGVPVVRIVVPGCRHFRNRFGPGRRTSVPERLGWPLPPGWQARPNPMPDCW